MPFPIVLAHGIARFDFLLQQLPATARADGLNYFKNIKTFLESNGYVVFHSDVSFSGSVERRSRELANQINGFLGDQYLKVHIIGHSMGGLDARHMIVDRPGMADKVASLTTIGTPHLGTPFADWGLAHEGHEIIKALDPLLDLEGFEDLSTAACAAFNQRAMDSEAMNSVTYQTCSSHEPMARVFPLLQPSWSIINETHGENDGLVPVQSQAWRDKLTASNGVTKLVSQKQFPVGADHLNQVGWWDPGELLGLRGPESYEAEIRGVYLAIARSMT